MGEIGIPVIDLKPFFDNVDDGSREKSLLQVAKACEEWGFFQVINHGVDDNLLQETLENCIHFFGLPTEEKLKLVTERSPIGFVNQSGVGGFVDRKEHLLFFTKKNPGWLLNAWPEKPASFRAIVEEVMTEAAKFSRFLTGILLESAGVPSDELQNLYKQEGDTMLLPFYPASPADYSMPVLGQHRDGDILTLLSPLNRVEGLQVLKDNEWVTVKPVENALIINIGDVMQVWSNGKYKSVMHRVVSNQVDRYSMAYFYMPGPETEIYPLKQFTTDMNVEAKYRKFLQGEYIKLRFENRKLDSSNRKEITIEHYAI